MKGPFAAWAAVGAALIAVIGCGHPASTRASAERAAWARPTPWPGVTVPVTLVPDAHSMRPLVDVSVGGGPQVPVLLDTGSYGLFVLPDAIGPDAQPIAGKPDDEKYLGGDLISQPTRALVRIGGSQRAVTSSPITVGSITPATDARYLHSLFGSVGASGIMGTAPVPANGALSHLSPLVQLQPPLSEGYTFKLPAQGTGTGALTLGRPVRSSATTSLPLVSAPGTYPNGRRGYQKDVDLCWSIGAARACGMTNLDTGAGIGIVGPGAIPGAPRSGVLVPPGTTVSISTPGGTALQSYVVGRSPSGRALVYGSLFAPTQFNTGIGFYFSDTVGWDLQAGQLLVTAGDA